MSLARRVRVSDHRKRSRTCTNGANLVQVFSSARMLRREVMRAKWKGLYESSRAVNNS